MFDLTRDIHPLTDFKRKTSEFLDQLRTTGEPVVLTINGKAELVVQDARSYQRLRELAERAETIAAVQAGLESMRRGEGQPAEEFFEELHSNGSSNEKPGAMDVHGRPPHPRGHRTGK